MELSVNHGLEIHYQGRFDSERPWEKTYECKFFSWRKTFERLPKSTIAKTFEPLTVHPSALPLRASVVKLVLHIKQSKGDTVFLPQRRAEVGQGGARRSKKFYQTTLI